MRYFVLLLFLLFPHIAHSNDIEEVDRSFIIRQEGIILYPYRDVAGFSTICVGHKVTKSDTIKDHYSMEECLDIFERDLAAIVIAENTCLVQNEQGNEFTAITDFSFNLGVSNACQSKLFMNINDNKIVELRNFTDWGNVHINGILVRNKSLTERRVREYIKYNQ